MAGEFRYVRAFPKGAFNSYAQQQTIICAIDVENKCRVYVIHRISRGAATIVHLCVDQEFRGKGIAFLLFDAFANNNSINIL